MWFDGRVMRVGGVIVRVVVCACVHAKERARDKVCAPAASLASRRLLGRGPHLRSLLFYAATAAKSAACHALDSTVAQLLMVVPA